MSNKSRVEDTILEAIKTAYGLALASASTEEQKKGIDNFYHIHLNSFWYQIPTWLDQEREKAKAEAFQLASDHFDDLHQGTPGAGWVSYPEMSEWLNEQFKITNREGA